RRRTPRRASRLFPPIKAPLAGRTAFGRRANRPATAVAITGVMMSSSRSRFRGHVHSFRHASAAGRFLDGHQTCSTSGPYQRIGVRSAKRTSRRLGSGASLMLKVQYPSAAPMPSPTRERAVVHIVDDDASMRGALEGLFESVGLDTRTYATAGA